MRRTYEFIICHHSATKRDTTRFEMVRDYHIQKGWQDIGYNWFVEAGKSCKGRDVTWAGAHCFADNMNYRSLGICLAGDFTKEQPTNFQVEILKEKVREWQKKYNIPNENILGHCEAAGGCSS